MILRATSPTITSDLWRTCDRWYQVVRYHRPEQLRRRAWNRLRDAFWLGSVPELREQVAMRPGKEFPLPERWKQCANSSVTELRSGRIKILGQAISMGWPYDWLSLSRLGLSPLVEFQLQYHEFLLEVLAHTLDPSEQESILEIIEHWIDAHGRRPHPVAWHPYCISRRIPVWAAALANTMSRPEARQRVIRSLASQTRWLEKRLERDLGGNHLWENARGLVIAGCLLTGRHARRWLDIGSRLLDEAIQTQLLPSGEHYERCPSYQADLARGLREAAHWIEPVDRARADRWESVAMKMEDLLDRIRHPDGSIPLWGDSSLDAIECRTPSRARRAPNREEWVGDYYVIQRGGHQLAFDAGDLGRDDLPAHAHADLLGFEMSAYGERLLVDSGAYCYSGPDRARYRQSRAHNVLIVDGQELADTWSSFRMGRRGHVVDRFTGQVADCVWVGAVHDAFAPIHVPRVTRIFFVASEQVWFCLDIPQPSDDTAHVHESFVHFAPSIVAERTGDGFRLGGGAGPTWWDPVGGAHDVVEATACHSSRFYREEPNRVLAVRRKSRGVALIGWCVTTSGSPAFPVASLEGDHLILGWTEGGRRRACRIRWRGSNLEKNRCSHE